jgi:hypothetical protein
MRVVVAEQLTTDTSAVQVVKVAVVQVVALVPVLLEQQTQVAAVEPRHTRVAHMVQAPMVVRVLLLLGIQEIKEARAV